MLPAAGRGRLNKQIAGDLGIHEGTVKLHRTAITTKLGVQSVAGLTSLCHEAGLLEPAAPLPEGVVVLSAAMRQRCIHAMQWAAMSIRVAIVEDDESVCRSLSQLLRAVGMEAACFHSAEAFLAGRDWDAFDCVVLDIQLGGMSGLDLLAKLGAEGNKLPIFFITAHDTAASRREARLNGCAGYFRKTDPGVEIVDAIRRAAWWRQDAQPGAAHIIRE